MRKLWHSSFNIIQNVKRSFKRGCAKLYALIYLLGFQKRLVECVRKDDGSYVNDKMCQKTEPKPPMKQACNTQPCAAEWGLQQFIALNKFPLNVIDSDTEIMGWKQWKCFFSFVFLTKKGRSPIFLLLNGLRLNFMWFVTRLDFVNS